MSKGQREDLRNTLIQLKNPQQQTGTKNWLRHGTGTIVARIDELLLKGATKNEMISDLVTKELSRNAQKAKSLIDKHMYSLKADVGGADPMGHGIPIIEMNDGKYMFDEDKIEEMLSNSSTKNFDRITKPSNGYLPTKEDFESAYRKLTRPGESISFDAVLDQIETNAKKKGLLLNSNWRMFTEKNMEVWEGGK